MPTRPAVLPAGMSWTCSWVRPIMMRVRCTFFTQKVHILGPNYVPGSKTDL